MEAARRRAAAGVAPRRRRPRRRPVPRQRASRERHRTKREALLHQIQQKVYDEAYFLPIWQLGFLCVTGPRVAVSGLGLIPDYIYSAPYEDVRLQA